MLCNAYIGRLVPSVRQLSEPRAQNSGPDPVSFNTRSVFGHCMCVERTAERNKQPETKQLAKEHDFRMKLRDLA